MDTSKKAGHTKRNCSPTKKDQKMIKAKKKILQTPLAKNFVLTEQ